MSEYKDNKFELTAGERATAKVLARLFNINGVRGDEALSEGQFLIFASIVIRPFNRVQIESCTQYGKSLTVALACLVVSCIQEKVISVIAPSDEKAKEIMRYYIQHLGDSRFFEEKLEKKTKLDRLRQEESKDRIILANGGGIFCLSTNERSYNKSIESAMGKGSEIVVVDEACLIRDNTEATIYRMVAGKGKDAFYCKIGNPFYSQAPYSHFFKTSQTYQKIWIDYNQALSEGRYTQEFIDEARGKPLFEILYEVKFPPKDSIDAEGFRFLISQEELENAFIDDLPEDLEGELKCGADIGRGGDESAFINRQNSKEYVEGVMWLESMNGSKDLMTQVVEIERIGAYKTFIDDAGVGGGVTDRCIEKGLNVEGINWASSPVDKMRFANKKAENYWSLKEFIGRGGKIVRNNHFYEILEIKYKINTSEKIQIESKENLLIRGVKSPNVADGSALTFNQYIEPGIW